IDIMGLQAAYANLHTDQERDYFMQRYHDVISSFGGKTSYDADNRPLLVMRSNLWASGYDVDGTDQTSLGQFSGRVQQTYKHSVPRFFVPEHGTMFTLALVRFFVILVVWFLLPRVARLMIHTPTAISIFVCLSMVQLMAVFISMR